MSKFPVMISSCSRLTALPNVDELPFSLIVLISFVALRVMVDYAPCLESFEESGCWFNRQEGGLQDDR